MMAQYSAQNNFRYNYIITIIFWHWTCEGTPRNGNFRNLVKWQRNTQQAFEVSSITVYTFPSSSFLLALLTLIKRSSAAKDYVIQILNFSQRFNHRHSITITNVKIAIFIILFSKITLSSQQVYGCFTIIFSTFWDIRKFSLKLLKTDSYLICQNVNKLRKVSGSGFLKELKYNFNVFI